ncbi:hypothetical protein BGW41_000936 [Actinomortierella wolfii]|nr:hypothetical protein BGW41_000936 [Actinomortierella wolfii]
MILRMVRTLLAGLTLFALIATTLLYNYARLSCRWKWPASTSDASFVRMVVMADPQMEGDAKIRRLGKRAIVDLAFNDAYMRHIYRSTMAPSWVDGSKPTHVSVLGDLFSSQWIDDEEFGVRLKRYQSIFVPPEQLYAQSPSSSASPLPILINVTGNHDIGYGYDINQWRVVRWEKVFGASNYLLSVDIPSSSTASSPNNSDRKLWFVVLNTMLLDGPASDESLRNDTWTFLRSAAEIRKTRPQDRVVLLTHIPLHKEAGLCVDPPDIRLSSSDQTIIEQTMLRPETSQWILNHLDPDYILNGHDHYGCVVEHSILVHGKTEQEAQEAHKDEKEGDKVDDDDDNDDDDDDDSTATSTVTEQWSAKRVDALTKHQTVRVDLSQPSLQTWMQLYGTNSSSTFRRTIREVTQRSMMAEYGGYSGLFEIRVTPPASNNAAAGDDNDSQSNSPMSLDMNYQSCGFYTDIVVWTVLVIDIIVIIASLLLALAALVWFAYQKIVHPMASQAPGLVMKPSLDFSKEKID